MFWVYFLLVMLILAVCAVGDEVKKLRTQNSPEDSVDEFYWPEDKVPELTKKEKIKKLLIEFKERYKKEKYKSKYFGYGIIGFGCLVMILSQI